MGHLGADVDASVRRAALELLCVSERFAVDLKSRAHAAENAAHHLAKDRVPAVEMRRGRDDDGDDLIDFPQDPGCDSAQDQNERDKWPLNGGSLRNTGIATLAIALVLLGAGIRLQRERRLKL